MKFDNNSNSSMQKPTSKAADEKIKTNASIMQQAAVEAATKITTTATATTATRALQSTTTILQSKNKLSSQNPLGLVKKKSATALICELTCLKSQQKYLECSQIKLNPAHFADPPTMPAPTISKSTDGLGGGGTGVATQMVIEIENLKVQLHEDLQVYRESSFREVQDLRCSVNEIRDDVRRPERLSQYTLPVLRERIISINTRLMQLCDKNQGELERLREECDKLERDNEVLVKV